MRCARTLSRESAIQRRAATAHGLVASAIGASAAVRLEELGESGTSGGISRFHSPTLYSEDYDATFQAQPTGRAPDKSQVVAHNNGVAARSSSVVNSAPRSDCELLGQSLLIGRAGARDERRA